MGVISTTDRVQHMMYQYYDEGHPLYDAGEAAKELSFFGETIARKEVIPAIYKRMDRILGTVMDEHLGPNDTLLVCSDHGFQSFRHQVNLNNWLAEKGYLKLKPNLKGNDTGLAFVDWAGTRAYSLGLGFIYLNVKGREPNGIVDPAEADALLAQIKADLLAYEDEKTGLKVCKEAYIVKEVHSGPYLEQEADLICGFAATYRVSWGTTLGGIAITSDGDGAMVPSPVITASNQNWSGDHVSVALSEVQGVFFSNRRVEAPAGGFKALHLAPTVLSLAGVAVPGEMDLGPLTVK
jgi:predicted AlkP superfamily phosphohydrolase/phosphomutase